MTALLSEWWRPLMTAMLLCATIFIMGPSDNTDRRLSDQLLVRQAKLADPAILLVEADAGDVRKYGGPPFSRVGLAMVLERLADAGVSRVLVDVYLPEPLDPLTDARLERAIARFGPGRVGLVTGLNPADKPDQRFARHATLIDGRLTADADGWHRQIGVPGAAWGPNPATWLATGKMDSTPVLLDLRINPSRFERRSARQLITSQDNLADRIAVIGSSVQIAPSRAMLPLNIAASRVSVWGVAAQSVKQGYAQNQQRGAEGSVALQMAAIVLGFCCALAARSGRMVLALSAAATILLFFACLMLGKSLGVAIFPVRTLGGFLVMANVTLVQRLRILPMMSSFLRGDITPEEVWAWRSWQTVSHPALLFSANGQIKRSNPAAAALIAAHGEHLAALCLPRLGERAEVVALDSGDQIGTVYLVDWPYDNLPLAVLRDNSEADAVQRQLEEQLLTDDLTGRFNRRGFERALDLAAQSGEAFTVFFVDMNGFKAINDTYGHHAGDELLVISAARLAGLVRSGDIVARLGGDEFALILRGAQSFARSALLARKIAEAIAQPCRLGSADIEVTVGAAVGYAETAGGAAAQNPAKLLRRADQAMYRDKKRSKPLAIAA